MADEKELTAREMGRRGGKSRAARLTPEQRAAIAGKAGRAAARELTPEQRADRARKGGLARSAKLAAMSQARGEAAEAAGRQAATEPVSPGDGRVSPDRAPPRRAGAGSARRTATGHDSRSGGQVASGAESGSAARAERAARPPGEDDSDR